MSQFRLISSNRIIAELFSDFNISQTDWVNKAYRFIEKAISIIGIDGYYIKNVQELIIKDYRAEAPCEARNIKALLIMENNNPVIIPLRSSYLINTKFNNNTLHGYKKATFEDNYIKTNFEEDTCILLYKSIPKDEEGFPIIPDNDLLLEAIPFYILMRLSYSGYIHPVITRQEAENKWREYYPIARNNINYPTIEEMQSFTEMYNNVIFYLLTLKHR